MTNMVTHVFRAARRVYVRTDVVRVPAVGFRRRWPRCYNILRPFVAGKSECSPFVSLIPTFHKHTHRHRYANRHYLKIIHMQIM